MRADRRECCSSIARAGRWPRARRGSSRRRRGSGRSPPRRGPRAPAPAPARRRVALVEDEVEHREHGPQPRRGAAPGPGPRSGSRSARTFRFARTSRWATVGSGSSSARAISGTVRPPTSRRVSGTWASSASAGWQQAKISSSRSSGIACSSSLGTSADRLLEVAGEQRLLLAPRAPRAAAGRSRGASRWSGSRRPACRARRRAASGRAPPRRRPAPPPRRGRRRPTAPGRARRTARPNSARKVAATTARGSAASVPLMAMAAPSPKDRGRPARPHLRPPATTRGARGEGALLGQSGVVDRPGRVPGEAGAYAPPPHSSTTDRGDSLPAACPGGWRAERAAWRCSASAASRSRCVRCISRMRRTSPRRAIVGLLRRWSRRYSSPARPASGHGCVNCAPHRRTTPAGWVAHG